jgi:hypothetical protein
MKPSKLVSKLKELPLNVLGFTTYIILATGNKIIQETKHAYNRINNFQDTLIDATLFPYYKRK